VAFSATSGLFLLLAALPATSAGVHTDGFRILQLLGGGPSAERWEASILITAIGYQGVRPADWPGDTVARAVAFQDNDPDDPGAALLAYHYEADRGNLVQAGVFLNRALDNAVHIPVFARAVYRIEDAWLALLRNQDLETAEGQFREIGTTGLFRQAALYRVKALAALVSGQAEEARRLAAEGLKAAEDDWDPGLREYDLDWLHRMASGWQLERRREEVVDGDRSFRSGERADGIAGPANGSQGIAAVDGLAEYE